MIKTMNNSTKERPILFSADMVRALIQDYHNPGMYKNQTRRTRGLERFNTLPEFLTERGWEIYDFVEEEPGLWLAISNDDSGEFPDIFNPWIKCPYGKVGDRLWIRESWKVGAWRTDTPSLAVDYLADGYVRKEWIPVDEEVHTKLVNQSIIDAERSGLIPLVGFRYQWEPGKAPTRTRPSMFMSRWASRILLEITEVKIERLQEITWRGAQLEGIECVWHDDYTSACLWKDYTGKSTGFIFERESYFSLWEKINGPDSVVLNPWVWVIKFKVLTINGVCNE